MKLQNQKLLFLGFCCFILMAIGLHSFARAPSDQLKPKVLIVVAHPDDEYFFAATTYRITHDLGGLVDQLVITDGRGGNRYSLLSQPVYHENLTDSEVAAKVLPKIRRQELEESGKILGIRKHFFLDHLDEKTLDLEKTYALWGGKEKVKQELREIVTQGDYDFIFTLLPTELNHGHHKAAGILSLEVVNEMKASARPVILASVARTVGESAEAVKQDDPQDSRSYVQYGNMGMTKILPALTLTFDRNIQFGFNGNLNYQMVVSWMIAAHKTQGAFQQYFNKHRYEDFKVFQVNSPEAINKTKALFVRLNDSVKDSQFKP